MLDSFTIDPPIFRHLIFPSFDWKALIASKRKFTLASETVGKDRVDVLIGRFLERSGFRFSTCRAFDFRFGRVHRADPC